jgi:methyl-accepting chemotaxis protein
MHRAVREIRRKIDEINKLVDYTEKMKTEMKADVNEVRYLNRTKEALAKISAKVQETNNKIKRLVQ